MIRFTRAALAWIVSRGMMTLVNGVRAYFAELAGVEVFVGLWPESGETGWLAGAFVPNTVVLRILAGTYLSSLPCHQANVVSATATSPNQNFQGCFLSANGS